MLASLADATIKQYGTTFKLWWRHCLSKSVDPYNCSKEVVIDFLTQQFNRNASYSSLNNHRSALSSLLINNNIGSDECIKRLLKGAYKLRPSKPRYSCTWKPQKVLSYICNWIPNAEIPIDKLAKKLVTLLALCTAHRVQTLSLIKIDNIHPTSDGIHIVITNIIKTSGPGREQPVLFLPYFRENPKICPATALESYISRTRHIRNGIENILLTTKPPYKSATTQTISRWIKSVLSESGVDVSKFKAHSTRHASTSAASAAGVCIDTIRKRAGWTTESCTFAKFYNRPLLDDAIFAKAVCIPTQSE